MVAYTSGKYEVADDLFQRLLNTDPNGPQAGPALTWQAGMRLRQPGRESEAEPLYQRALAVESPDGYDAGATMAAYASYLRKQGRTEEAQELRDRVMAGAKTPATAAQAGEVRLRNAPGEGSPVPPPLAAQAAILPPGVYRVGHGVTAPKLTAKVEPSYDDGDRGAGIAGTVLLSIEVGADGRAHNASVVRSLTPGLDEKAIEAVMQWQFQPGTKDGAPVTVQATIEVNFRLM